MYYIYYFNIADSVHAMRNNNLIIVYSLNGAKQSDYMKSLFKFMSYHILPNYKNKTEKATLNIERICNYYCILNQSYSVIVLMNLD